jgi:hypothetical protein
MYCIKSRKGIAIYGDCAGRAVDCPVVEFLSVAGSGLTVFTYTFIYWGGWATKKRGIGTQTDAPPFTQTTPLSAFFSSAHY